MQYQMHALAPSWERSVDQFHNPSALGTYFFRTVLFLWAGNGGDEILTSVAICSSALTLALGETVITVFWVSKELSLKVL